ncbi:hypothetical protein M1N23_03595, partial [Dehalococcoidia bacterium]|nr:hypothetical protein [Dehalococcoidia bacterium]
MAIFTAMGSTNAGVSAETQVSSNRINVLIVDRESIQKSPHNRDLVNSFLALTFKLKEGQPFVFTPLDDPTTTLGPIVTTADGFGAERARLAEMLNASVLSTRNLANALAMTYNFLGDQGAGKESAIYFITGSRHPAVPDRLGSIARLLNEASWPVNTITLPGASDKVIQVLSHLSDQTEGDTFAINVLDGLYEFAERTLRADTKGALTSLSGRRLGPNAIFEVNLDIAPGTREANMLFFRESISTAFHIQNPEVDDASVGDRTSSTIDEQPHLVIWQLIDPTPGRWNIDVSGVTGAFFAWEYSFNKYGLALLDPGTVPLDQPWTLTASVTEDGKRVPLEAVRLVAKITSPNGSSVFHELNDGGVRGDAIAGDGYFAATLPPLSIAGEQTIDLELSWPDFEHTIKTLGSFDTQAFPSLQITTLETDELRPLERTKVATVFSNVGGQPFSILAGEIAVEGVTNSGELGKLELVPQSVITQGSAYMYDLYYTATSEALASIIVRLNLEYAGRQHGFSTDSLVLSSVPRPTPPVMSAPPPASEPVPPPKPPAPILTAQPSGVPISLIITLSVVGGMIIALIAYRVIYWLTRTTPFGYLYNDRGQPVVDFSNLPRKSIYDLRSPDKIGGHELGVPGLENVTFAFRGEEVYMTGEHASGLGAKSVRVNNQPLFEKTQIHDNTWIG